MSRKTVPQFKPKDPPLKNTTLARQVAKQNLQTLNNALWVTENSYTLTSSSFSSIKMPSGVGAHGCYGTATQWSSAVDEQRLWVRQHILVSAASLLEAYLESAISAALWSTPEYADRSLSGVREVELIKFNDRAPGFGKVVRMHTKAMLKGRWEARLRQMAIVFGRLPPKLTAIAPRLQALQDKRNRIAHGFGREPDLPRRTPWEPVMAIKLEVPEVEQALICVTQAMRETDVHLFAPLIGAYEFLYEYHAWLNGFTDPFTRPSPDLFARTFRRHIATRFGNAPNKKYFQSMIRYYDACK
jgi:hypothetical protein